MSWFYSLVCSMLVSFFFFFNDPPPTEIYTLPLPDALPISPRPRGPGSNPGTPAVRLSLAAGRGAGRAVAPIARQTHAGEVRDGRRRFAATRRLIAMHVHAQRAPGRPAQVMPGDGAIAPPPGALRPGPRHAVALVDVRDERLHSRPARFVVQRVRELGADAGKARRRKGEQVVDLARAPRQGGIHPGPVAQPPQLTIVVR